MRCPDCSAITYRCPSGHLLCFDCGWQADGCDHPTEEPGCPVSDAVGGETEGPDVLSGGPPPEKFSIIYKPGCEPPAVEPRRCDAEHMGTGEQCLREEHNGDDHKYTSDAEEPSHAQACYICGKLGDRTKMVSLEQRSASWGGWAHPDCLPTVGGG